MNKGHTMLKSLTLSLLALSVWAADPPEKEVKLPAPVIKAEEVMNDAVAKARTAYLKAVEAEVKRLQAVLEKEKAAATKAGLLEVAMAIKAKQEALVAAEVAGKALEGAGELLGDGLKTDIAKAIVGKWTVTYSNGHVDVISVDNFMHVKVVSSTWSPVDFDLVLNKNKLTVTRAGSVETFSLDKNGTIVVQHGVNVTATLVKSN